MQERDESVHPSAERHGGEPVTITAFPLHHAMSRSAERSPGRRQARDAAESRVGAAGPVGAPGDAGGRVVVPVEVSGGDRAGRVSTPITVHLAGAVWASCSAA